MASEFNSAAFYNKLKEEKKLVGVKCQTAATCRPSPGLCARNATGST